MRTTLSTHAAGLLAAALLGASGCATQDQQVKTPRYTLSYPDYWEIKKVGNEDGTPTVVKITRFGDADMSYVGTTTRNDTTEVRGVSSGESKLADPEVHIYAWPTRELPPGILSNIVADMLLNEAELDLRTHNKLAERPPECQLLPKKFKVMGVDQEPLNLFKAQRWRTIVVGAHGGPSLFAIVARVPYDQPRYCENLRHLQVNLQNLLDGFHPAATAPAAPTPTAPTPAVAAPPPQAGPPEAPAGPGPATPPAGDGTPQTTAPSSPQR